MAIIWSGEYLYDMYVYFKLTYNIMNLLANIFAINNLFIYVLVGMSREALLKTTNLFIISIKSTMKRLNYIFSM